MNKFAKIYDFISLNLFNYVNSFKNNMVKSTVKNIDFKNKKIALFIRGSRDVIHFNIFDIFYDTILISSLSSLSSFEIGYFCGINFSLFSKSAGKKSLDYSLNSNPEKYCCSIIYMDRKKNIVFNYVSKNCIKEFNMSPLEIKNRKGLIKNFHPIQACYIGLLAGCYKENYN